MSGALRGPTKSDLRAAWYRSGFYSEEETSQCRNTIFTSIRKNRPSVSTCAKGAGLPDLADPKEWAFDGTATQGELPPDLVKRIDANGHSFRDMN
jgi:hypothetical protein